ncbi:MAG TPA: hypothetical protein VJ895_01745 [Candidatus Nanoarchaeia archaeon]|nr:hypothetical protein [Candidatus Nanoarchaeia archaeon]
MLNKEIITAYRKIKNLGFSKKEAYQIFRKNISCVDYICENYLFLNKALDKVSNMKLRRGDLCSKLEKQVREEKKDIIFETFEENPYEFL